MYVTVAIQLKPASETHKNSIKNTQRHKGFKVKIVNKKKNKLRAEVRTAKYIKQTCSSKSFQHPCPESDPLDYLRTREISGKLTRKAVQENKSCARKLRALAFSTRNSF